MTPNHASSQSPETRHARRSTILVIGLAALIEFVGIVAVIARRILS
jgi:hypothetical protein